MSIVLTPNIKPSINSYWLTGILCALWGYSLINLADYIIALKVYGKIWHLVSCAWLSVVVKQGLSLEELRKQFSSTTDSYIQQVKVGFKLVLCLFYTGMPGHVLLQGKNSMKQKINLVWP